MFLGNRKIKAKSLEFVGALPPAIDEETTKRLVEELKLENDVMKKGSIKQKIINGHLGLALQIAGRYATRIKNKDDDLVGYAFYGVTLAVSRIETQLKHDNVKGYIIALIHGTISDFLKKEKNQRGIDRYSVCKREEVKGPLEINGINLEETISKCLLDEQDKRIFELRDQGYNDQQIAEMLGVTKQWVNAIRTQIKNRILRRLL